MNFADITDFNTKNRKANRARKMITIMLAVLVAFIATLFGTSWVVYHKIQLTYSENYTALTEAGFTNLLTAPEVVSEEFLLLLTLGPMAGLAILVPIFYLFAQQLLELFDEIPSDDDQDNL